MALFLAGCWLLVFFSLLAEVGVIVSLFWLGGAGFLFCFLPLVLCCFFSVVFCGSLLWVVELFSTSKKAILNEAEEVEIHLEVKWMIAAFVNEDSS